MLETWTGRPVTALAAPHGICDDRLVTLAERSGYEAIFTADEGLAQLGDNPLRLPRVEVRGGWDLQQFAERLREAR
jgi:hypothetical protein